MKTNLGYTEKEKEYSAKSMKANLAGGFLAGFTNIGFVKAFKTMNPKRPIGFGMSKSGRALGLISKGLQLSSLYYDYKAVESSKVKTRAIANAIGRNLAGTAASFVGGGSAGFLRFKGLPKTKSFLQKASANPTVAFYKAKPVNEGAKLGNMMKDRVNRAVKFVRIRGRIVPIFGGGKVVSVPKKLAAPKG